MYHKFVWCHISLGRGWNKELSQWESCVLAVLCINPPAARVKQPDRYGRMYQLYKLLIYFVSAAQIRRSASGYGRKRKKTKKEKLVPVSWRPHAYPGDLGSAGYISPRIYLTPASYLLGWLGSRPCISFKVLERSPLGWIYVYIYVLVILLFLSFFLDVNGRTTKKRKINARSWNGMELKKKKRNIENKSSTKVSDHQTTSTKAAIIKTRPRRDFSSI